MRALELEMQNEALRALQAKLQESRDRYYELYELAPAGYLTLDAAGRVVQANLRAAQALGVERGELVGTPFARFMSAADADRLHEHLHDVFSRGGQQSCDVVLQGRGPLAGQSIPVRLESLAWTSAGEAECRCALLDVSALRQEQEARRASETQLHHAQKMEAIGTLAGGVAHDFNNLLMGIRGCANIVLSKLDLNDSARLYLEEIVLATRRGASVTQQLLTFARSREEDVAVFELNALVERMKRLLARLLGEDVEIRMKLDGVDSCVRANATQIEQVLLNLAVNARHAMPEGGTLSIETYRERLCDTDRADLAPGDYVVLAVSDTGTGMSEQTLQRIFEPFFTTKAATGTGLGLSTAHGIVKGAKGEIRVESKLGVGTRFEIFLPHTDAPVTLPVEFSEPGELSHGHGTILLVEDESLVRLGARFYLERAGYRVLEASTSAEAVECCEKYKGPIDLLLSDVVLPGTGGRDIARQVRELRPELPVLFMSAHPLDVLTRQGHLEPHATVLQKPFDPGTLLGRVAQLLGQVEACTAGASAGEAAASTVRSAGQEGRRAASSEERELPCRGTALVVEDEALARMVISEQLRYEGWTVLEAAGGEQAIALARAQPVDVLLTDYQLPDIFGHVVAQEAMKCRPRLRVVYMSGYTDLELEPRGTVLLKPLDLDELIGVLAGAGEAEGTG